MGRALATLVLLLLVAGPAWAGTYFVSPTGSAVGAGTSVSPWSLSHALGRLSPGDTLILKDGQYLEALDVKSSGAPQSPITIKAEHDGAATIDGEKQRLPCKVLGADGAELHDIVIEGIVCRNSSDHVFEIKESSRVTLRRVSAYDSPFEAKRSVFLILDSSEVLLEDCAASGWGRNLYAAQSSQGIRLRRCWGGWKGWEGQSAVEGDNWIIQLYGSSGCTLENNVGTTLHSNPSIPCAGMNVWCNTWNTGASNNLLRGNVVHGMTFWSYLDASNKVRISGNRFENNVAVGSFGGFAQRGDADLKVSNHTQAELTDVSHFWVKEQPCNKDEQGNEIAKDPDWEMHGTVVNSVFIGSAAVWGFSVDLATKYCTSAKCSLAHDHNALFALKGSYLGTAKGPHEVLDVDPAFDTARYGKGAYLIRPAALRGKGEGGGDLGAEVLFRYEKAGLTKERLWPWPMEDRICKETGTSVTWEQSGSCKGGLWKALEGVYPAAVAADASPRADARSDGSPGLPDDGRADAATTTGAASPSQGCCRVAGSQDPGALLFLMVAAAVLPFLLRRRRS